VHGIDAIASEPPELRAARANGPRPGKAPQLLPLRMVFIGKGSPFRRIAAANDTSAWAGKTKSPGASLQPGPQWQR
jgi:hypothetical protein